MSIDWATKRAARFGPKVRRLLELPAAFPSCIVARTGPNLDSRPTNTSLARSPCGAPMRLATLARRPRLVIEPLEARENPSGIVNATLNGGVLTLAGDDLDNVVEVQQTGPGAFTILGTNTTIQG